MRETQLYKTCQNTEQKSCKWATTLIGKYHATFQESCQQNKRMFSLMCVKIYIYKHVGGTVLHLVEVIPVPVKKPPAFHHNEELLHMPM